MSLNPTTIDHIAIICSNYERSKHFYTQILGFSEIGEHYREEKQSWKCDLKVNENVFIELFSFPNPPPRPSYPEACGLRHLAFETDDIEGTVRSLEAQGIEVEKTRIDQHTSKKHTFFHDPDGLPFELYES